MDLKVLHGVLCIIVWVTSNLLGAGTRIKNIIIIQWKPPLAGFDVLGGEGKVLQQEVLLLFVGVEHTFL